MNIIKILPFKSDTSTVAIPNESSSSFNTLFKRWFNAWFDSSVKSTITMSSLFIICSSWLSPAILMLNLASTLTQLIIEFIFCKKCNSMKYNNSFHLGWQYKGHVSLLQNIWYIPEYCLHILQTFHGQHLVPQVGVDWSLALLLLFCHHLLLQLMFCQPFGTSSVSLKIVERCIWMLLSLLKWESQ